MSTLPTLSRHTETTTMLKLLPKITEQTKTLTLMVDSDLLETMEISKLDSKISMLNQMSMDTDSPKLEIKSQITEMETDSELELQLIPPIIPLEEELLLLTEDSTHKEMETLSSLDSKTLLLLKITNSEQKLLA
jgi:hypothetical protein